MAITTSATISDGDLSFKLGACGKSDNGHSSCNYDITYYVAKVLVSIMVLPVHVINGMAISFCSYDLSY